jgi:hypothetical protein
MEKQSKVFCYFIINFLLGGFFVLGVFAIIGWQQNKVHNKNDLIVNDLIVKDVSYIAQPAKYSETHMKSLSYESQHNITIDVLELLINLAKETRKYFKTIFAYNNINKNTNIDIFERSQINNFVSMDIKFEQLSKNFKTFAHEDEIIEKIGVILTNFSILCKRGTDLIIKVNKNGVDSLEFSVATARNNAEFQRDWHELLELVGSFVRRNKEFLDETEKSYFSEKLANSFGQNINECLAFYKEHGNLSGLSFYDGGWLPVSMYLALACRP